MTNAQKPIAIWLTGLRKSGKSTLAARVEAILLAAGQRCYVLDDARLRQRLNRDLTQTVMGDAEAARRMGEVAKLMVDAGLIVICTSSSPYRAVRHGVRDMFKEDEYLEVYLATPIECCQRRDSEGIYEFAARRRATDVPEVGVAFQAPEAPDLLVSAESDSPEVLASKLIHLLQSRGVDC